METTKSAAASPLMTLQEVGRLFGLSRSAVYRAASEGSLPVEVIRISERSLRVRRRDVDRILNGDAPTPTPIGPSTDASA